tara:strand:- start:44 stop:235 length:192 start_codon:yes stop_codon:yes gene_type:complete
MWQTPMQGDVVLPFALHEDKGILLGFGKKFTQFTNIKFKIIFEKPQMIKVRIIVSYNLFVNYT